MLPLAQHVTFVVSKAAQTGSETLPLTQHMAFGVLKAAQTGSETLPLAQYPGFGVLKAAKVRPAGGKDRTPTHRRDPRPRPRCVGGT